MVDSWCEVKIDFMFIKRNGECGICDNQSGKVGAERLYRHCGETIDLSGEELRWFFDEYENLFIRSPPAPIRKRLHENFDDCRRITYNITRNCEFPVIYYQYIPLDDDDVVNDIYEKARASRFDFRRRSDVSIEVVTIDGGEYLRLMVTVYSAIFFDTVVSAFYEILSEVWLE